MSGQRVKDQEGKGESTPNTLDHSICAMYAEVFHL